MHAYMITHAVDPKTNIEKITWRMMLVGDGKIRYPYDAESSPG